jgi:hypothetical protein
VNVEQIHAIFWLSCDFIIFNDDMKLLCLQIMIVSVTNVLPHGLPCHHIYDECFHHKDYATSTIMSHNISHVERHNCTNCDIFKHMMN